MAYLPIEDYGLIGNMHTAALIGRNGSIDWLCLPNFDSPSVFGRILDEHKAGFFQIAPELTNVTRKQVYWPDTNVLITRFLGNDAVVEIIDYMPVGKKRGEAGFHQLIRHVEMIRGSVPIKVECCPAFNYARDKHTVELFPGGAVFRSDSLDIELTTPTDLKMNAGGCGVETVLNLKQGERATFALRPLDKQYKGAQVLDPEIERKLLEETIDYWHRWIKRSNYKGRWRTMVNRSALALKLLTFEPTGAIVAAPGVFSRLLLDSFTGSPDRISAWRKRHPIVFAAGCGLAVAAIGLVTAGATSGGGYETTRGLLEGTHSEPVVYAFGKLVATWLSVWSGVPGGLFAPSLAIGAGIGSDVALFAAPGDHAALIALGMVAFLAATTQAPLTAFIIVMEMIDGHAMVLSLMACALVASLVSRLLSPPLYATLAQAQLQARSQARAAAKAEA